MLLLSGSSLVVIVSLLAAGVVATQDCCAPRQWLFLISAPCFALVTVCSSSTPCFRLFKLAAVLLHEMGHALASWVSCGAVLGIEVEANELGATHWMGRARITAWLVHPSGYVGATVLSAATVLACASPGSVLAAAAAHACIFAVAFLYARYGRDAFGERTTLTYLSLLFCAAALLFGVAAAATWSELDGGAGSAAATVFFLFVGCTCLIYSVVDVMTDTVLQVHPDSDASHCAALLPTLLSSKGVGKAWFAICICIAATVPPLFLYLAAEAGEASAKPPLWAFLPGAASAFFLLARCCGNLGPEICSS